MLSTLLFEVDSKNNAINIHAEVSKINISYIAL
jgi:hypothetical protein